MKEAKCFKCKKIIEKDVKECPHCGQVNPTTKKLAAKLVASAVILILIAAISIMLSEPNKTDTTASNKSEQDTTADTTAFAICKDYVVKTLNLPPTAKFPPTDYKSWTTEDGSSAVKSYVDTENNYGASVKFKWHCKVKYKNGDKLDPLNWELLEFEALPNS
ncbi:MAG: hypothetical protein OCC45_08110 [Desulfotalea sp.]